jgi:hypothetical protein
MTRAGDPEVTFKVSLEALESSAHVPLDDQVESKQEAPTPDAVSEEWRLQQETLRFAGW